MNPTTKGRGRPATGRKATRNVTLDADAADILNRVQAQLTTRFGFTPTLSQTVKHIASAHVSVVKKDAAS